MKIVGQTKVRTIRCLTNEKQLLEKQNLLYCSNQITINCLKVTKGTCRLLQFCATDVERWGISGLNVRKKKHM